MAELTQYPIVVLNGKRLIAKQDNLEGIGYALVDPDNKNGMSYAHVKKGAIKRFGKVIANECDLVETEEFDHMSGGDEISGILQMMKLF